MSLSLAYVARDFLFDWFIILLYALTYYVPYSIMASIVYRRKIVPEIKGTYPIHFTIEDQVGGSNGTSYWLP